MLNKSHHNRPELSNQTIVMLVLASIVVAIVIRIIPILSKFESSFGQASATLRALFERMYCGVRHFD